MELPDSPVAWAAAAFAIGGLAGLLAGRRGGRLKLRAATEQSGRTLDATQKALAKAEERVMPVDAANEDLLVSLGRAHADLAAAADRDAVVRALVTAVERTFRPEQHMVFVAAGRESKDLVLAASAGSPWTAGARLSDTMGRVGLVARKRTAMFRDQFESESPIVREQVEST